MPLDNRYRKELINNNSFRYQGHPKDFYLLGVFLLFVLSNHRRKSNEEKFDKIGKDEVDYVENTNFYFR